MKRESEPGPSRRPTKKFVIFAFIGVVVIIVFIIIIVRMVENSTINPNFPAILPIGKTIDNLGGWKRLDPPGNDPVFTYSDTIGTVQLSVTEQAIPKSFQSDVAAKVAELAKNYNATTTVDADGSKVYIGTSTKGPQSVVFVKHDVLILIKSQSKITNSAWARYAASLTNANVSALPTF